MPTDAARIAAIDETALRLRRAIGRAVGAGADLQPAVAALSATYRSGEMAPADQAPVRDPTTAAAYAAARIPATFAATARAMAAIAERAPAFEPTTLLDVGAGSGAAAWAASAVWPTLARLTLVERERAAVELGRRLVAGHPGALATASWLVADLQNARPDPADIVVAGYVLGEIAEPVRMTVLSRLWETTTGVLALVEPGSRAGFERIRTARTALIAAGGHVIAPCPGDLACPLTGPEWCHFLARLDRSPLQRRAKDAARSWEDEPFSYVAIGRTPWVAASPAPRVVLGRPRQRPGMIELRVCRDGRIERRTLSRRDGPAWRAARDLAWGDPVPPAVLAAGAVASDGAGHRTSRHRPDGPSPADAPVADARSADPGPDDQVRPDASPPHPST